MKKEAREKAEKLFKSKGKMTNVEIAKKAGVNPLTVGKWKREDDWTKKLTEKAKEPKETTEPGPIRKKGAHDDALKLYLDSGGKIANKELAGKVGVSAATISKWKASEDWSTLPAPKVPQDEAAEEKEIDLDALASPEHITLLNKRIEDMLSQTYLSPIDLKTLAEAKEAVLGAVSAYVDVIERICED